MILNTSTPYNICNHPLELTEVTKLDKVILVDTDETLQIPLTHVGKCRKFGVTYISPRIKMWTISPVATNSHSEYTHLNTSTNTYTILSNEDSTPYKFKFDEVSGNYLCNYDPSISRSNTRRIRGASSIANNTLHKKIKRPCTTPTTSQAAYYMEFSEQVDNISYNIISPPEIVQIMSIGNQQPATSLNTLEFGNSDTTRKKDTVTCPNVSIASEFNTLQGTCHILNSSTVSQPISNQISFNQSDTIIQSSQIGGANNNESQIAGVNCNESLDNNVNSNSGGANSLDNNVNSNSGSVNSNSGGANKNVNNNIVNNNHVSNNNVNILNSVSVNSNSGGANKNVNNNIVNDNHVSNNNVNNHIGNTGETKSIDNHVNNISDDIIIVDIIIDDNIIVDILNNNNIVINNNANNNNVTNNNVNNNNVNNDDIKRDLLSAKRNLQEFQSTSNSTINRDISEANGNKRITTGAIDTTDIVRGAITTSAIGEIRGDNNEGGIYFIDNTMSTNIYPADYNYIDHDNRYSEYVNNINVNHSNVNHSNVNDTNISKNVNHNNVNNINANNNNATDNNVNNNIELQCIVHSTDPDDLSPAVRVVVHSDSESDKCDARYCEAYTSAEGYRCDNATTTVDDRKYNDCYGTTEHGAEYRSLELQRTPTPLRSSFTEPTMYIDL